VAVTAERGEWRFRNASDSHADERKKSRRVTSRGNRGFIDAQSGKERRYPIRQGAAKSEAQ
jgi:hypothetical protein